MSSRFEKNTDRNVEGIRTIKIDGLFMCIYVHLLKDNNKIMNMYNIAYTIYIVNIFKQLNLYNIKIKVSDKL